MEEGNPKGTAALTGIQNMKRHGHFLLSVQPKGTVPLLEANLVGKNE
jgi:hypothetical protein